MKRTTGQFTKKPMGLIFSVEHFGGKRFMQFGAGYVHKEKEARRHRSGRRPHGLDRRMG